MKIQKKFYCKWIWRGVFSASQTESALTEDVLRKECKPLMANENKDTEQQKKINGRLLLVTAAFLVLLSLVVVILLMTNPYRDLPKERSTEKSEYGFFGAGTENEPYLISSVEDFCLFRDLVNAGNTFSGQYFLQTDNIDLSGISNWTPIGEFGSGSYFYGNYNGDGHTVSSLTVTDTDNGALFGMLHGEVRNLGIESGNIEGENAASIACHGSPTAVVTNCYNKAEVHGTGWAGGIAVDFQGKISYCWNLGEITCDTERAAGISAYNAQIEKCYSYNMPVVTDLHNGDIKGSREFDSFDGIDWTDQLYLSQYNVELHRDASGKYTKQLRYIVKSGNTVSFKRRYTPSAVVKNNIKIFLSDYGAMLILIPGALVFIIIAIRKPAARGAVLTIVMVFGGIKIVNDTLSLKDPLRFKSMQDFYLQPEGSVDVLLLGSSRTGMNQDCELLWNDYGISGYALYGGSQPAWNSYYYLVEALKHRSPKIIVFDVITAVLAPNQSDKFHTVANTYGMRLSLDKLEAIQITASQELWLDCLIGFSTYHTRYSELTKDDFELYSWSDTGKFDKSYPVRYGSGTIKYNDNVQSIKNIYNIPKQQEEYLLKIINRCKAEDIPLVLVASNVPNRQNYQPNLNYIAGLAAEYDIPFINYNLLDEETGFVPRDFYIDNGHLNTNGARKQSAYLGQYLKEHYDLTDHKGNPYYSSWDEFAIQQQNLYIPMITDRSDYLKELVRDDRTAVIIKQSVATSDPAYEAFLQDAADCGFDMSFMDNVGKGIWVVDHPENSIENTFYGLYGQTAFQLGDGEMSIAADGKVIYADATVTAARAGVVCIVYDPNTGKIIDKCLLFDPSKSIVDEQPKEPVDPHLTIAHV